MSRKMLPHCKTFCTPNNFCAENIFHSADTQKPKSHPLNEDGSWMMKLMLKLFLFLRFLFFFSAFALVSHDLYPPSPLSHRLILIVIGIIETSAELFLFAVRMFGCEHFVFGSF